MAFDVKHINPLDLTPSISVGVSIPFSAGAVFNKTYETKDAIKANLINYFLTNKGQRYLNPNFGSNLRSLLFENITNDSLDDIKEIIAEDLKNYFPKVSPSNLEVTGEPDRNAVRFYMKYRIIDSNIEDQLALDITQ
mgnify:CR=1 FL=1